MRSIAAIVCLENFAILVLVPTVRHSVLVLLGLTGVAAAEGERSPMIGGGVIAGSQRSPDDEVGLVGVNLEATYWWHRLGIAVEGSRRWDVASGQAQSATFGGGLRLLVADRLFGSIIEPRDVELGLELHGVIERSWFDDRSPGSTTYGGGIALRLRGGGDAFDSSLLAESRLFVRVMATPKSDADAIARSTEQPMATREAMTVMVGLGAAWGSGERRYADKFRSRFATPVVFPTN